jgi:hypothetical protein
MITQELIEAAAVIASGLTGEAYSRGQLAPGNMEAIAQTAVRLAKLIEAEARKPSRDALPFARGRGIDTATTSAPLVPHLEQRIRLPTASSVALGPHSRASASGSAIRCAPHLHVIRTRKCPSASSSFLMCGSTHARIVATGETPRPCSPSAVDGLYDCRSKARCRPRMTRLRSSFVAGTPYA